MIRKDDWTILGATTLDASILGVTILGASILRATGLGVTVGPVSFLMEVDLGGGDGDGAGVVQSRKQLKSYLA